MLIEGWEVDKPEGLFKVVDDETAKTVAIFDSTRAEAEAGFLRLLLKYPERAEFLVLVSMTKDGQPILAQDAGDLELSGGESVIDLPNSVDLGLLDPSHER
jgi:hypothetical protein